jgi:hypothetical protein
MSRLVKTRPTSRVWTRRSTRTVRRTALTLGAPSMAQGERLSAVVRLSVAARMVPHTGRLRHCRTILPLAKTTIVHGHRTSSPPLRWTSYSSLYYRGREGWCVLFAGLPAYRRHVLYRTQPAAHLRMDAAAHWTAALVLPLKRAGENLYRISAAAHRPRATHWARTAASFRTAAAARSTAVRARHLIRVAAGVSPTSAAAPTTVLHAATPARSAEHT